MRTFKFFRGFVDDKVIYWSLDAEYGGAEYWSNYTDEQERLRENRNRQREEQTQRMRNFGVVNNRRGSGRYHNPYARRR
jgi:hypothetical protein